MSLFDTLPNEILEQIFYLLDSDTIKNTRCIQNTYICNKTRCTSFQECADNNCFIYMNWILYTTHDKYTIRDWYEYTLSTHNLQALQYLLNVGFVYKYELLRKAAEYGNYKIIKFLHNNHYALHAKVFNVILKYKHMHMIPFLIKNRCAVNDQTTELAAQNGLINVLEYCILNNVIPDHDTFAHAAMYTDTTVLEFLHSINCEMHINAYTGAVNTNNCGNVKWLLDHGAPDGYTTHSHINILRVCIEMQNDILQKAIANRSYDIIELLLQYKYTVTDFALQTAKTCNDTRITQLLCDYK